MDCPVKASEVKHGSKQEVLLKGTIAKDFKPLFFVD
jgi:hypothetical protein